MSHILASAHPLVIELIESPSPYVIPISILISQSVFQLQQVELEFPMFAFAFLTLVYCVKSAIVTLLN